MTNKRGRAPPITITYELRKSRRTCPIETDKMTGAAENEITKGIKMTKGAKTNEKGVETVCRKSALITRTYELRKSRRTVPIETTGGATRAETTKGKDMIEGDQTNTGLETTKKGVDTSIKGAESGGEKENETRAETADTVETIEKGTVMGAETIKDRQSQKIEASISSKKKLIEEHKKAISSMMRVSDDDIDIDDDDDDNDDDDDDVDDDDDFDDDDIDKDEESEVNEKEEMKGGVKVNVVVKLNESNVVMKHTFREKRKSLGASISSRTVPKGKRKSMKNDSSWRITGSCDGGPEVPYVIPSWGGHIGHSMAINPSMLRGPLKCLERHSRLVSLTNEDVPDDVLSHVRDSQLLDLRSCMIPHLDDALISAFIERWQPDTNTFHLPFGEVSIMLHDVEMILGIRAWGKPCVVETNNTDDHTVDDEDGGEIIDKGFLVDLGVLFGCNIDDVKGGRVPIYLDGGILSSKLTEILRTGTFNEKVKAYVMLLGQSLFVDKSGDRIRGSMLGLLDNVDKIGEYAWGAGALTFLYRQLGKATRIGSKEISGCLTLLQVWIYEHFPTFRPFRVEYPNDGPLALGWKNVSHYKSNDSDLLNAYRKTLDGLRVEDVKWMPYGPRTIKRHPHTLFCGFIRFGQIVEPYHPDRCMRQFGFVQVIPRHMPRPVVVHRPPAPKFGYRLGYGKYVDEAWEYMEYHLINLSNLSVLATMPFDAHPDYMPWYVKVSHPTLLLEEVRGQKRRRGSLADHPEAAMAPARKFRSVYYIQSRTAQVDLLTRMMNEMEPYFCEG